MALSNTPSGIEWRYTAKRVRLGSFDASAVVPPLVLFAMHIKMWTFIFLIVTVITMWIMEVFFRLPFGEALRSFRRIIAGNRRNAIPWWDQKKL